MRLCSNAKAAAVLHPMRVVECSDRVLPLVTKANFSFLLSAGRNAFLGFPRYEKLMSAL
jgi:hypothetical protein